MRAALAFSARKRALCGTASFNATTSTPHQPHKTIKSVRSLIPVTSILHCADVTCNSQTATQIASFQITASIFPALIRTVSESSTGLQYFTPANHNKQAIPSAHDVHDPRMDSRRLRPSHSTPQAALQPKQAEPVQNYARARGRRCTENLHHMRRLRGVVEEERDCVVPKYWNGSDEPCALKGNGLSLRTDKDKSIGSAAEWVAIDR
jgi:hypothetical protein